MNDQQLKDRLSEYKALVEEYTPDSVEDNYFLRSNSLARVRAAYLEVVVDLDGNEDDFKRCLELSGAPSNFHNYEESIDDLLGDMKAYAQLIKKFK